MLRSSVKTINGTSWFIPKGEKMGEYLKMRRRHTERVWKEYDEAHALVEKFLIEREAPPDVLAAFKKASNKPTVMWA